MGSRDSIILIIVALLFILYFLISFFVIKGYLKKKRNIAKSVFLRKIYNAFQSIRNQQFVLLFIVSLLGTIVVYYFVWRFYSS